MVGPTILQNDLFMYIVLPFLLVFSIVFAVLQKTEILGKGKKQIDALVSLAVALIVVAFGNYVQIIGEMVAFMGVAIVVILIFLILTGAFYEQGSFKLGNNAKMIGMGVVIIAVVVALLIYTGAWGYIKNLFSGQSGGGILSNVVFVIVIAAAVAAVAFTGGGKSGDEGK